MNKNNIPTLTREQAIFLLDLELDTYAKKARVIAKAARELHFESEEEEDTFHEAINRGFWKVSSDRYYINPLEPLGQVAFICPADDTRFSYTTTRDFEKAASFTKEMLEQASELYIYNAPEFLLSEFEAVSKYGDIEAWLRGEEEELVAINDSQTTNIEVEPQYLFSEKTTNTSTLVQGKAKIRLK